MAAYVAGTETNVRSSDVASATLAVEGSWGNGGWGEGPWGEANALWYGLVEEGSALGDSQSAKVVFARSVLQAAVTSADGGTQLGATAVSADSARSGGSYSHQAGWGVLAEGRAAAADFGISNQHFDADVLVQALGDALPSAQAFDDFWEDVNSFQTPGWGAVGDAQSGAWAMVVDAQGGSWQNTGTSPVGSWVDVDDTQPTSWN